VPQPGAPGRADRPRRRRRAGHAKKPDDRYPTAGALADAALAALADDGTADASTRALDRPPVPLDAKKRLLQHGVSSRTLVELPDAGFTAPEPAGAPPPSPARRRGPLIAAAAAVVVIAVVVAVPLLSRGATRRRPG
jgi:hypothetical protein